VTRARCVLAAVATSVGVALAGAPAAEAVPSVTYKCSPAPQDCLTWYRSDVRIDWTVIPADAAITGCQDKTFSADTAGTNEFCRADDGSAEVTVQLKIKVDKTPPVVTGGAPARAADANGWYNHAVLLTFSGTDQTSGIAGCTSTTYGGPDSAAASVAGVCTDKAGNASSPLGYGLKYDATGPDVTEVRPERPPDHLGWFNRPVRFDAFGADAMSGLAECPPVVYSGPDGAAAQLNAGCHDRAGNTTTRTFVLPFDATAPVLAGLEAAAGDRRIDVRWRPTPDAQTVEVVRSPGLASAAESVVFSGRSQGFRDRKVVNGRRYTYRVRLMDAAGNAATGSASAKAGPRLISPASRARRKASRPPLLRWTPVRRAGYYNVQVFRGGRKVLSAWPVKPRYRLQRSWTYGGRHHRLSRGIYRWYVWPGYGDPSDRRFGRLIGARVLRIG
jgi:hypothetical protein